jgi:hypothetical protein
MSCATAGRPWQDRCGRRHDEAVNAIKKVENATIDRKVERQRKSGPREGHQPHRGRTEFLQDGEKGRIAALADPGKNFADHVIRMFSGHHALMLQEAAPAIDLVPIENGIQGKEKGIGVA